MPVCSNIYIYFFWEVWKQQISHCCAAQRALTECSHALKDIYHSNGGFSVSFYLFFLSTFSVSILFYFCGLSHFCHIHAPFSFQKLFLPLFSTALEKSHRNKCIGACLFFHLPFFGLFTIRQSLYWNTNLPSSCLENAAILHWTFDILMPK